MNCPKCKGEMELGETKSLGGYAGKTIWDQGDISFWGKSFKENTKSVIVYRCKLCGYLESYAK